jgi:TRAP-type mannitol/chloroaromatic compound transport system substrate-binding protein
MAWFMAGERHPGPSAARAVAEGQVKMGHANNQILLLLLTES